MNGGRGGFVHAGAGTYRQWGELVAAEVERLQLGPLVDAEGQLRDLVAAQVEPLQAAQRVQALGHPAQVVAGKVHVWQNAAERDGGERRVGVRGKEGLKGEVLWGLIKDIYIAMSA